MKAILEFDLPAESVEHRTALNGSAWAGAMYELDQWLRGINKHGPESKIEVSEVRGKLYEELNARGLEFE